MKQTKVFTQLPSSPMRLRKQEGGFVIVTIMVLLAIWASILGLFVSLSHQRSLVQKSIRQTELADNLTQQIRMILRDPVACRQSLAGAPASAINQVRSAPPGPPRRFQRNDYFDYSNFLGMGPAPATRGLLRITDFRITNIDLATNTATLNVTYSKEGSTTGSPALVRSLDLSITLAGANIDQCLEDNPNTVRAACESLGGTLAAGQCRELDIVGSLNTGYFRSDGLMHGTNNVSVGSFNGPGATLSGGNVTVTNTFQTGGSANAANKLRAIGNLISGGNAIGSSNLCTGGDPVLGCGSDCIPASSWATHACPSSQRLLSISMTGVITCGAW